MKSFDVNNIKPLHLLKKKKNDLTQKCIGKYFNTSKNEVKEHEVEDM